VQNEKCKFNKRKNLVHFEFCILNFAFCIGV
jgi:hypothetical protein